MKANLGKTYIGLTDIPGQRKQEHGNPSDWTIQRQFAREDEARKWESSLLTVSKEARGGPGGKGWRYGYAYTITDSTIE